MLSISDYKNWAVQHQTATVLLNNNSTGLVNESSRITSPFAYIFKRGTVKALRGDVVKDFTRALSSRYGASIAQQAVSLVGLSPTSTLKGRTISQAIFIAKTLRSQMLNPGGETQDLRLGNTNVSRVRLETYLADKQNAITKFLKQRAVAVQLLGEMPLNQADYEDFHARATNIVERLTALRDADVPEGIPAEDFRTAVDSLIHVVRDRDAKMHELQDNRPLAEANVDEYKNVWQSAAINALTAMHNTAVQRGDAAAANVLERAKTLLSTDPQTRQDFHDRIALSKEVESKYIKPFLLDLIDKAKRQLTQEHVNVRGARIDSGNIVRNVKVGFRQALNARPWPVIDKTISVSVGNQPVVLKSTISPAEQLGHSAQSPRGPIADSYAPDVHGYMCHSADTEHAVNLAVTNLTVGDPGGEPKTAFTGIRHGVHCAWEIRSANERTTANANRAKEAVIAAFLAKYDGAGNNLQLPEAGEDGTITVNLSMTSVSLLTPDPVRHKFQRNSSSDERFMLREQSEAWDSVEQTGVTFQYKGRQITVRPQVLKFNFGVNTGAVNFKWPFQLLTGGWLVSDAMNNAAFATLAQEAETFIQAHPDDPKATAAQTLLDQCRQIFRTKSERSDSHDAYKFASRVAVLSHLMGKVPCWNCKSGKDRTGEMDVECKFLSTLIARGEAIPEPGAPLTKAQQELFRSIALGSGNFELQKQNTSLAGFKTDGVSSIGERLGGQDYHAYHKGGSMHVNV